MLTVQQKTIAKIIGDMETLNYNNNFAIKLHINLNAAQAMQMLVLQATEIVSKNTIGELLDYIDVKIAEDNSCIYFTNIAFFA